MIRRIARIDANQPFIVKEFRKRGCSVLHMHQLGKGAPDLLVAKAGRQVPIEVKLEDGELTSDEADFHKEWKGTIFIVRGIEGVNKVVDWLEGK